MSMRRHNTHFTMTGSDAHDMLGPTAMSSDGPMLLTQLKAIAMELVLSIPDKIIIKKVMIHTRINIVMKASSDTCEE